MQTKTYDESDLRKDDEGGYKFIEDVAGFHAELLETSDNNVVADKLRKHKLIPPGTKLDPESCCFYAYFKDKKTGNSFLKMLNTYLSTKAQLTRDARAY
jgi:hypothetical protein